MTPLIELTALFVAGDLVGLRAAAGWLPPAALLAACALLAPVLAGRSLSRRSVRLSFVLMGCAAGGSTARSAATDCRAAIPDGTVFEGTGLLEAGAAPGGRAVLVLEDVRIRGRRSDCTRRVRIRLPDRMDEDLAGGHARFAGTWWRAEPAAGWPRPPDRSGTLSVRSIERARADHAHVMSGIRDAAFRRIRTRFPNETPLAESLLLARRESLDVAVRDDFAAAGLAHLLAISGAHVGILAAMVVLLAGVLRMRPRASAMAATVIAVAYVVLLGAPAAAARAALQSIALLASRLAQRPADRLTLLAGAALVLTAADPAAPLGAGFQLSFAGVYGLLVFGPPIARVLPDSWPRPLASALVPTLAATAATAPIAAWHFGLVSLIGPISNLVAAPLLALAIPAMALSLAVGLVADPMAAFVAGGAETLLMMLRGVAAAAVRMPASHAWVSSDAVTAAVVATAAFLLCGPSLRHRFRPDPARMDRSDRRARQVARAGVAAAILIGWPVLRPAGSLEIHAIDVGQGDAIAIRTPGGHWIVIDTGPASPTFDAGRQRVAPYLRSQGVGRIDLLVLTHPDMDHIGGARAVFESFDVTTVMDPAVATGKDLYFETLGAARKAGGAWVAAESGRELNAGGVVIRVLAPDSALLDGLHEANDLSVVLRLEYGEFSGLFLGDAHEAIENRLVARHGAALASNFLKVGHHGSRTSTGDSLLAAVRPDLAFISVGRRNRYGHPDPQVMARLRRYGVSVARTDESGSLVLRVRPDGSMRLFATR
jgi:competence protein ComEC